MVFTSMKQCWVALSNDSDRESEAGECRDHGRLTTREAVGPQRSLVRKLLAEGKPAIAFEPQSMPCAFLLRGSRLGKSALIRSAPSLELIPIAIKLISIGNQKPENPSGNEKPQA